MSSEEKQRGVAEAAAARAELYGTLSQLKDRLNYAQRVDDAVDDAKRRITEQKRRNPLGFMIGVAGVAVVVGAVVWGVATTVAKRVS
ncbi:DUF3618 domain-containing protein [Leucobacter insecticola]|uniref:DUF3618 domain-containing protein n=1 Tax=Leucobacter insecticola TaxID=2714934 RepID=A0A6G8FGU8_9MICO|nr:DUF3618 domain-containing protein [Leucobacter insecticola]QIM15690.1 DUF3618 domain-containing protein [Leucobacter insecticola]